MSINICHPEGRIARIYYDYRDLRYEMQRFWRQGLDSARGNPVPLRHCLHTAFAIKHTLETRARELVCHSRCDGCVCRLVQVVAKFKKLMSLLAKFAPCLAQNDTTISLQVVCEAQKALGPCSSIDIDGCIVAGDKYVEVAFSCRGIPDVESLSATANREVDRLPSGAASPAPSTTSMSPPSDLPSNKRKWMNEHLGFGSVYAPASRSWFVERPSTVPRESTPTPMTKVLNMGDVALKSYNARLPRSRREGTTLAAIRALGTEDQARQGSLVTANFLLHGRERKRKRDDPAMYRDQRWTPYLERMTDKSGGKRFPEFDTVQRVDAQVSKRRRIRESLVVPSSHAAADMSIGGTREKRMRMFRTLPRKDQGRIFEEMKALARKVRLEGLRKGWSPSRIVRAFTKRRDAQSFPPFNPSAIDKLIDDMKDHVDDEEGGGADSSDDKTNVGDDDVGTSDSLPAPSLSRKGEDLGDTDEAANCESTGLDPLSSEEYAAAVLLMRSSRRVAWATR